MRQLCKWRIAISGLLLAAAFGISTSVAEEVIIEEKSSIGNILIGDYSCSLCPSSLVTASLEMRADAQQYGTIELTAGELWLFFDKQGYDSVNTMSLYLDVDQLSTEQSVSLSKLNVQIQNPTGGNLLTDANLGTDRLIVPGIETSSNRPEAELRFDLGYDFMKLFSEDSTEIVRVSIDTPASGVTAPTFRLAGNGMVFGQTNLGQMFLFVVFWGAVFLMLLRWMKPVRRTIPIRSTGLASHTAASARQPTA